MLLQLRLFYIRVNRINININVEKYGSLWQRWVVDKCSQTFFWCDLMLLSKDVHGYEHSLNLIHC